MKREPSSRDPNLGLVLTILIVFVVVTLAMLGLVR